MVWIVESIVSTFLIALGLGQLASTLAGSQGVSLVGANRWGGLILGLGLFLAGAWLLPHSLYTLAWVPLTAPLAFGLLLLAGSFIAPPLHPNALFQPEHPAHGGCRPVKIWDGVGETPGYLLLPPCAQGEDKVRAAVCLVHGAGDHKTFFKWPIIRTLLAEGLAVLTIDLPGHGDYRHRPLIYPDCMPTIPAAVQFLREELRINQVGLVGISLGGAVAINATAQYFLGHGRHLVEALVVMETPTHLNFTKALFYREAWNTFYRAPVLALLRETTLKQVRDEWYTGGYRSRHTVTELFELLNPLQYLQKLTSLPILLVYSRGDCIAPPEQAEALRRAAPQAQWLESKKASHVMLTLMPEINQQLTSWLKEQLILVR
jgi:pimeloyl-ACP methyl ester carboxylesterase